jgi:hypothetical protein
MEQPDDGEDGCGKGTDYFFPFFLSLDLEDGADVVVLTSIEVAGYGSSPTYDLCCHHHGRA